MIIKRLLVSMATLALVGGLSAPAEAAPSTKANQPMCFSDTSATCVQKGSTFTLTNVTLGEGSGVYVENQTLAGKPLSEAGVLSFRYSGTVGGGSPRFAIPVDNPAVGGSSYDFFLAAQATYCDQNRDGVVSLSEPGCIVEAGDFFGLFSDYVALHPTYLIGSYYTFIVTDIPGTVTLSEVNLARKSPGKIK